MRYLSLISCLVLVSCGKYNTLPPQAEKRVFTACSPADPEIAKSPLHAAAAEGRTEDVRKLLDDTTSPVDMNAKASTGKTALQCAIENGKADTAELLLAKGADGTGVDLTAIADGKVRGVVAKSDLQKRIMLGSATPDDVKAAADHGADLNAPISTGGTLLALSIARRNQDVARALIQNGAKIDGEHGKKALLAAVGSKRTELVTMLFDSCLDVTEPDALEALHQTAAIGHAGILEILVHHTKNVDACLASEQATLTTPLMKAARGGHVNAMKILLDNGAKPTATDLEGMSAIQYAAKAGKLEAVKLLAARDASLLDETTPDGKSLAQLVSDTLAQQSNLDSTGLRAVQAYLVSLNAPAPAPAVSPEVLNAVRIIGGGAGPIPLMNLLPALLKAKPN